jgi:hypothetical protein
LREPDSRGKAYIVSSKLLWNKSDDLLRQLINRMKEEITLQNFLFETGSPYISRARLELVILLPQPPMSGDYRHVPAHPALFQNYFN